MGAHPRAKLAGLLLGELGLVAGLHAMLRIEGFRVRWSEPQPWLEETPFEEALGAVLLLVAIALAYWLLVSTVVEVIAVTAGRSCLVEARRWAALPAIRRLVGRAVAVSIFASTVGGPVAPAAAAPNGADEDRVVVDVGSAGPLRPTGTGEAEADHGVGIPVFPHLLTTTGREEPDRPVASSGEDREAPDGTVPHHIEVGRGDHLWSLAERHLRRITGRLDLDERQIARYWVRVIEENRSRIRSGNPDLIYPGETLVMPAVEQ